MYPNLNIVKFLTFTQELIKILPARRVSGLRRIKADWLRGGRRRFWQRGGKLEAKVSCRFLKFYVLHIEDRKKLGVLHIADEPLSDASVRSLDTIQQELMAHCL